MLKICLQAVEGGFICLKELQAVFKIYGFYLAGPE